VSSAINPLSYLDSAAYQSMAPASSNSSTASTTAQTNGVSATSELQAMEQQGNFQAYMNDSLAAALLQPATQTDTTSGLSSATLIQNMVQQVLGAYQASITPPSSNTSTITASG